MNDENCPKCGGPMLYGEPRAYQSNFYFKPEGLGKRDMPPVIGRARACRQCGYVELFLDARELGGSRS